MPAMTSMMTYDFYYFFCVSALVSGIVKMSTTVSDLHGAVVNLDHRISNRKSRARSTTPMPSTLQARPPSRSVPGKSKSKVLGETDARQGMQKRGAMPEPESPVLLDSPEQAEPAISVDQSTRGTKKVSDRRNGQPDEKEPDRHRGNPGFVDGYPAAETQQDCDSQSFGGQLSEAMTAVIYAGDLCSTCHLSSPTVACGGCHKPLHSSSDCSDTYQDGYHCKRCYLALGSDNQFFQMDEPARHEPELSQASQEASPCQSEVLDLSAPRNGAHCTPKTSPAFPSRCDSAGSSVVIVDSSPEVQQNSVAPKLQEYHPNVVYESPDQNRRPDVPLSCKVEDGCEGYSSGVRTTGVLEPVENRQPPQNSHTPLNTRKPNNSKAVPRKSQMSPYVKQEQAVIASPALTQVPEPFAVKEESSTSQHFTPRHTAIPLRNTAGFPGQFPQPTNAFQTPHRRTPAPLHCLTTPDGRSNVSLKHRPRTLHSHQLSQQSPSLIAQQLKTTPATKRRGTESSDPWTPKVPRQNEVGGSGGRVGIVKAEPGTVKRENGGAGVVVQQRIVQPHKCSAACGEALPEFRPDRGPFHCIGSIRVQAEAYNQALGSSTGRPLNDTAHYAVEFSKNLSLLLWEREEFNGHNIAGVGQNMYPLCEQRLQNMMTEVRKVFPCGMAGVPSSQYSWVPKFLKEKLNRYYRSLRFNRSKGEIWFILTFVFLVVDNGMVFSCFGVVLPFLADSRQLLTRSGR